MVMGRANNVRVLGATSPSKQLEELAKREISRTKWPAVMAVAPVYFSYIES